MQTGQSNLNQKLSSVASSLGDYESQAKQRRQRRI